MANHEATAAIFHGAGQPFELRPLPRPVPVGREVVVRVTCCTICGSDLHTFTGRRTAPTPTILGHEIVGRIAAFGPEASRTDSVGDPLREGDRVTWSMASSCGGCFFCERDLPQKCDDLFKYGHEPLQRHPALSGGLAESCVIRPGTALIRLPDEIPEAVACPANCATATVVAALRAAGGCRGRTVLIQGAGMLGLTACALAKESGAARVLCSDVNAERLRLARGFRADLCSSPDFDELSSVVAAATGGRGVDVALEFSGSAKAVETGWRLPRVGGTYVLVGTVAPTPAVTLDPEQVVRRLLTIRGVHNYAPPDLIAAVEFLARSWKRYPFADLVAETHPLSEVRRAFERALDPARLRVAVVPDA